MARVALYAAAMTNATTMMFERRRRICAVRVVVCV